MDKNKIIKLSRLYVDTALEKDSEIALSSEHAHYLRNVLRRGKNDNVRLFNGKDGEWLGTITELGKKKVTLHLKQQIAPQPPAKLPVHLLFAPIKKTRLDWLIEKSVELGVTNLHPVLTQNTQTRKLRADRITHQIIEAAEQCERLDIPTLNPLKNLWETLEGWDKIVPLYACIERAGAPSLPKILDHTKPAAFLIGPEGGFPMEEKQRISAYDFVQPVDLGNTILRAETAAIYALCMMRL